MGGPDHFESVAEDYAAARPQYPQQLYDRLAAMGVIGPGKRILEVGAGSGQATAPLVERGCLVTAIEPGPGLAASLRAAVPAAVVLADPVEVAALPTGAFDSVVAATSLHWVDLPAALPRLHDALVPGGSLAVWRTVYGDPRTRTPFRDAVAAIVAARSSATVHRDSLDPRPTLAELTSGGFFAPVETWTHPWQVDLEADQIHRLFRTFSDWTDAEVDAVGAAAREQGPLIREHYVTHLHLLRRA